ncbi:MAG: hypothetical protein SPD80_04235 [Atopobium sp.]|uniref:hypothetical protein n=1 Tax=Atopobium sp. TaxID=1872650 RepID=UPI002A80A9A8|nr:hypothetical protein [Atopobium sp.]MDY4522781.1 hypothetical protein [Atopobium sp.]
MKITYRKAVTIFIGLVLLLFVVPSLINLMRLAKEYQEGPSVQAALDSNSVGYDRPLYGLTYKFEYEDKDDEGNTQYHFISTRGENVPKVIVCKFLWFDELSFVMLPSRTPAGWQYIKNNENEWEEAYIKWIKSPNYDGRKLPPEYQKYVPKKPQEEPSSNDTSGVPSNNSVSS